MKNIKKIIQIILVSTSILILSGCFSTDLSKDLSKKFSKDDMKIPIQEYFKKEFGISGEVKIYSASNYALEGIDHQVYFGIDTPYHAYLNLIVNRDTLKVIPDNQKLYSEIFKAAYVQQHPEIIRLSNNLIQKYNLKRPEQDAADETGELKKAMVEDLDYLRINIGGKTQVTELVNQFKKNQSIDTSKILPTIIKSEPKEYKPRMGIVNFIYEYELTDNNKKVPHSKDLVEEFKKSKLLKKGLYNIEIFVIDESSFIDEEESSYILFKVDENGEYTLIPVSPV